MLKLIKEKNCWLLPIGIILFAIIKQILTANLFIIAPADSVHDDYMMVKMADEIINRHWLGSYTQYTLVKGAFFPFYLAVLHMIGIPYLFGTNFLYTLSCIIFVIGVGKLFKSKISIFILYLALLFNPVSFAFHTFQRVYRNGITLSQVLIIFGCLIGLYLRRNESAKSLIKWAAGAGLGVASLWHTREDGIWILPVLFVAVFVTGASIFLSAKKQGTGIPWKKYGIVLLPIVMLFGSNLLISVKNYRNYGIFSYNEINNSNFGNAMKSIYSVKNNEEIPCVSVTREKMKRLYEVCPTLKKLEPYLEQSLNSWDNWDRTPGDTQVEDGWFFWCLRDAVDMAGYYVNAKAANAVYKQISDEIETALDNKKLERQAAMPSALMSPWRKGYAARLKDTFGEIIKFVITYEDVGTSNPVTPKTENMERIKIFEAVSNNTALYPPIGVSNLTGWYTDFENNEDILLKILDENDKVIEEIQKMDSVDVKTYLEGLGVTAPGAQLCRFSTDFRLSSGIAYLAVYDKDGIEIERIPLDKSIMGDNNGRREFVFDEITFSDDSIKASYTQKYVNRLNAIGRIYKSTGVVVSLMGIIFYAYIMIMAFEKLRTKDKSFWNGGLALTSILCSLLVLIFGVAYNHIASCYSIFYLYLSGSYPLIIAFGVISICLGVEGICLDGHSANKEETIGT